MTIVSVLFAWGCAEKDEPTAPGNGTDEAQQFYTDSAKAVFDARCVSCHRGRHASGGVTPLSSFAGVSAVASPIQTRVENGTMPLAGSTQANEITQSERDVLLEFAQKVTN
ncbi:MAG: hypothetical protein GF398_03905 [Chitinivibrionales bacterium]|nr:hypothetical protein [Chitinivibrionales bacterium]